MLSMKPKQKEIEEVNSLLGVLADPKRAQQYLDDIVKAIAENEETSKKAREASADAGNRIKAAEKAEQTNVAEGQRLNGLSRNLKDRENTLKDDISDFNCQTEDISNSLNERESNLESREDAVTNRERDIARIQANADATMETAHELKREYERRIKKMISDAQGV